MRPSAGDQPSTWRPRLVLFTAIVVVALVVAACDPAYSYWVRNDARRDVIVTFTFEGRSVVVPAGVAGVGTSNIGTYQGSIEVAGADCRTTTVLDATTQTGLLTVDDAGARLTDLAGSAASVFESLPVGTLQETERCVGHVQAGPSTQPLLPRAILFIGGTGRDIYRIGSGASSPVLVADIKDSAQTLSASADGTVIAYDGLDPAGGVTVFTRTGDADPVPAVASAWGAAVSNDGTRLAYMKGENSYEDGVLYVRTVGGVEHRVADHASRVVWAPTGDWLAYEVFTGTTIANDLWIVRPDGSGARRLTTDSQRGRFAVWAPDGARVAYAILPPDSDAASEPSASRIVIFTLDGASHEIPDTPPGGWTAAGWSPDGSRILVDVFQEATGWVASVDPSTGENLRLSHPPAGVGDSPVGWSPDASTVLFARESGDYSELWLVGSGGADERLLVTGVTEAVWGPAGR